MIALFTYIMADVDLDVVGDQLWGLSFPESESGCCLLTYSISRTKSIYSW